CARSNSNFDFW
nr:immunoglobulin heavy chain junction region [Macaca mulatta]MOV47726.1 immunoglobulin heavy chain junction region [Macaca mulatta]MOV47881.1 immunoglobulin heavy chain junction region [Macaca mulatta]MOV48038.1 immunoglobulin heavy chain junction region [Macaca mulatta]MOV48039.1 immunoglobulin heavy chain junction region [Macaca mulatta]